VQLVTRPAWLRSWIAASHPPVAAAYALAVKSLERQQRFAAAASTTNGVAIPYWQDFGGFGGRSLALRQDARHLPWRR
jgi:hypothetical protein